MFQSLAKRNKIDTNGRSLLNIMITFDLNHVIILLQDEEKDMCIASYDLNSENYDCEWEHPISGSYLKAECFEQSHDGKVVALGYQDEGQYRTLFFRPDSGDGEIDIIDELDINDELEVDFTDSPGIDDIFQSLNTTAFMTDSKVSIVVFERKVHIHYQFIYDYEEKKIVSEV